MSWDLEFSEPVPLPGGRKAATLRQAAEYVLELPPRERGHGAWQNAADALRLVADHKGDPMCARMAVMKALHKDRPPAPLTDRKDRPWGRRPLKRDAG